MEMLQSEQMVFVILSVRLYIQRTTNEPPQLRQRRRRWRYRIGLTGHDASFVAAKPPQINYTYQAQTSPHFVQNKEEAKQPSQNGRNSSSAPLPSSQRLRIIPALHATAHMAFMVTYMVANVMDNQGNKYNLFREYKMFDTLNMHASLAIPDGITPAQPLFQPGETYLGKANNDMLDANSFQVQPYLSPQSVYRGAGNAVGPLAYLSGRFDLGARR